MFSVLKAEFLLMTSPVREIPDVLFVLQFLSLLLLRMFTLYFA